MSSKFDCSVVDQVLEEIGREQKDTIAILHAIQDHYRYLPREVFPYLAEQIGISEATIYGVATFYENFSLEPKGKYVIGKSANFSISPFANSPLKVMK